MGQRSYVMFFVCLAKVFCNLQGKCCDWHREKEQVEEENLLIGGVDDSVNSTERLRNGKGQGLILKWVFCRPLLHAIFLEALSWRFREGFCMNCCSSNIGSGIFLAFTGTILIWFYCNQLFFQHLIWLLQLHVKWVLEVVQPY